MAAAKRVGIFMSYLTVEQINAKAREQGLDLMRRAHEDCPYSRATRGNIEVTLSVGGVSADEGRAAA